MGTSVGLAWMNQSRWDMFQGWIGMTHFDEDNAVGQRFLDDYEARCGRRPENSFAIHSRDVATALLSAFADAHPLTPNGVKDALERVKMVPAACGSPGTRISFGKWTRRGWMGTGYLVARRLNGEFGRSERVCRFGEA
jgi:hypothetical protein